MLGESSWESHVGRVMGESSGSGRVMRWRCMGDARELANPGILVSRSNISFYSLEYSASMAMLFATVRVLVITRNILYEQQLKDI